MDTMQQNKMADAPLGPLIVRMSLPTVCTMMVASLYNIVDSVFISRVSEQALTALSLAIPVQTIVAAISSGLGTGICALASRSLGAGDKKHAESIASQGIMLGAGIGLMFLLLGIVLPRWYLGLFTEEGAVVAFGIRYLRICLLFSFTVAMETVLEKILQASGNMIWPMCFGLAGMGLNIVLDPLLIFGMAGFPKLGITGAALATGISQSVAMILAFCIALSSRNPIRLRKKYFRLCRQDFWQVMDIALPVIIQQSMSAFTTGLMDRILIGFGEVAVNVYNVFFRLQNLFMKPVLGIHVSLLPVLSFNYGAGNRQRLRQAIIFGTTLGVGLLAAGMIPFIVWPAGLLSLFHADSQMMTVGIPAFRTICLYFPLAGATICLSTSFAALSKSIYSMWISLIRQAVVLLPAAWFLSRIGLESTWWCYFIAEVAALVLCLGLFRRLYRTKIKKL